jgi:ribosomal protein L11 methylase PrmA
MSRLKISSSFRDPSGFLFIENGEIYRQINQSYRAHYDYFIKSSLYNNLVESNLLVKQTEIPQDMAGGSPNHYPDYYKLIKPEPVPFISYPHEWCFDELKDAALATLKIQQVALKHGMSLKDASAFNIQFKNGRPVLIDTLSFEKYKVGSPWIAYRQFCQHFLGPLALMYYRDYRLNQLFRIYIDGLPLDLVSALLPKRTFCRIAILIHIHLHAKAQKYYSHRTLDKTKQNVKRQSMFGIIDNLEATIRKFTYKLPESEWSNYYEDIHYSSAALSHKSTLVLHVLDRLKPKIVWDLGANTGLFSRLASNRGIPTVAFDIDHAAVTRNYRECREKNQTNLLPLVLDLANPTSGFGWGNQERMSLRERGPADLVLALALMHHLRISNNIPLEKIAQFFAELCQWCLIEYIPKTDPMAQRLLENREDIFQDYHEKEFEQCFNNYFQQMTRYDIDDSDRKLHLYQKR